MKIALGADHAGFALKQQVGDALTQAGQEVVDLVRVFREAPFDGGRHSRRAEKIAKLEQG